MTSGLMRASIAGALILAAVWMDHGGPALGCPPERRGDVAPSPSLYCLELVPVPDLPGASGVADLELAPSPFGIAVSPEGYQRFRVTLRLEGLPAPPSLGPYTTYVAWATTPMLDAMEKLGPVGNGATRLGTVAFNKFYVMVSAEASADLPARQGRLVLRGTSPSTLMLPHDVQLLPPQRPIQGHEHDATAGWRPPPMHPAVPRMIPGLEALSPPARPFVPLGGRDPASLPEARPRQVVTLRDGDTLRLEAAPVRRSIAGRTLAMYGFNGQYPGPLIRVRQGTTIVVDFTNRLELPSTVHWHGVRVENRFDGVPDVTQPLVPPGGSFRYHVRFRDAGVYWYHPHHREDIQQDLGLYGNLFVEASRAGYFGLVNREEFLIVDDLLLARDGGLVPFGEETPTHALMGRFGNLLLVNGEPQYRLAARRGEVVRFFLTNASNTRTFNLSFVGGDVPLKVVGSDVGRFEREEWVESVVLAPAERYIVEGLFDRPGRYRLVNRVQGIDHPAGVFVPEVDTLGVVEVADWPPERDHRATFARLRVDRDVVAEIDRYRSRFERPPDRELLLTLETGDLPFGLVQVLRLDTGYINPVEWSGTMPMMDWLPTGHAVRWVLREPATGRENTAIDWRFRVGDVVKLRLVNDRHTLHAMHHPVHIHGQRFLVLARNGVPNENLVWKDTVLLPAGGTVDVLLEVSNPGRWMLHCHIAEHLEAGMHLVFTVE